MQNESQGLSWIGQNLRPESLEREGFAWDWSHLKPLVQRIPASQAEASEATNVEQNRTGPAGMVPNDSVRLPKKFAGASTSKLRVKQLWEGTVVACEEERFTARLSDRTNPANPDEIAEFDLEEVAPDDQYLVNPGALFYWSIGTEQTPARQVKNVAVVNFRRLPRWTQSSFRKAEQRAKNVLAIFAQE